LVRAGGVEHGEQLLKVGVGREEHVVLAGDLLEETTHVLKKDKRQKDNGQHAEGKIREKGTKSVNGAAIRAEAESKGNS